MKEKKFIPNQPIFVYENGEVFPSYRQMGKYYGVGGQTVRNCIIGRVSSWDGFHILTVDPSRWDKYSMYFNTPDEWRDLLWDIDRLYPLIEYKYSIKSNEQFRTMKHIAIQERKYETAAKIQDILCEEPCISLNEISRRLDSNPQTVKRYIDQWEHIFTDHSFMHGDIEPVELDWRTFEYEIHNR